MKSFTLYIHILQNKKASVYSFIGVYLYISLYWLLVRATGVFLLKQLGITVSNCIYFHLFFFFCLKANILYYKIKDK
ncbi:hypothetical protein BY458DRAFT_276224 [Sporodiniella umbellata]|nr:hypothetical protein BY458DRAFT_276224 [Sporodiniella umbellata]